MGGLSRVHAGLVRRWYVVGVCTVAKEDSVGTTRGLIYIQIITGTHTTHTVHDTHDMCTHVSWRVNIHFDLLEQGTVRVVTPKL